MPHRDDVAPSVGGALGRSERLESVEALAVSFHGAVFEPAWWPAGVAQPMYYLDVLPARVSYRITATHASGVDLHVVGVAENPRARPPYEREWRALPELAAVRGVVRTKGSYVQASLTKEGQTIALVGFACEQDIIKVVSSLNRVTPTVGP